MYFKSRICPAYIFIVDCLSPFYLALHFQGTLWLEWCLKLVKGASHIAEEIFAGGGLKGGGHSLYCYICITVFSCGRLLEMQ